MSRRFLPAMAFAMALLAGCGSIGGPKVALKVYSPQVRVTPDPAWPQGDWQLTIGMQAANDVLDSSRIAVRPTPNELQTYRGVMWADNAPDLLQTAIVQAFEDAGRLPSASRFGGGGRGDMGLLVEVRAFETVYRDGTPEAVIEVQARLLNFRGGGVATQRFRHAVPGATAEVPAMVDAFGEAMSKVSGDVVGWTLVEGNRLRAEAKARTPG